MSADDPYAAPHSSALTLPDEFRDRGWRGILWYVVPVLMMGGAYLILDFDHRQLDSTLYDAFQILVSLVAPAALAGWDSQRRSRSSGWPRYLAQAVLHAVAWVLYFCMLAPLISNGDSLQEWASLALPMMMIWIPATLLLATTFRLYDRWRP